MNDADLWRTVSQQSKRHEGISWGVWGVLGSQRIGGQSQPPGGTDDAELEARIEARLKD